MIESTFLFVISFAVFVFVFIVMLLKKIPLRKIALISLFYFYLVAVIGVTLFPFPVDPEVLAQGRRPHSLDQNNFTPFKFVEDSIGTLAHDPRMPYIPFSSSLAVVMRQVGGNVLLGMPFGVIVPLIWSDLRRFSKIFMAGLLFSFSIEAAQFLLSALLGYSYRTTDVDDIILNVSGVVIGYGFLKIGQALGRTLSQKSKKQTTYL